MQLENEKSGLNKIPGFNHIGLGGFARLVNYMYIVLVRNNITSYNEVIEHKNLVLKILDKMLTPVASYR